MVLKRPALPGYLEGLAPSRLVLALKGNKRCLLAASGEDYLQKLQIRLAPCNPLKTYIFLEHKIRRIFLRINRGKKTITIRFRRIDSPFQWVLRCFRSSYLAPGARSPPTAELSPASVPPIHHFHRHLGSLFLYLALLGTSSS